MIDPKKFPPLNLPPFDAKVRSASEQIQIFDRFRGKYVALTPEEWVRQHFAHYLTSCYDVPSTLLNIEYQISYARLKKRPDITVMSPNGAIWALIECKSPHVRLTEEIVYQTILYGSVLHPVHIVMTNGEQHIFCWFSPEKKKFVLINDLPKFQLN